MMTEGRKWGLSCSGTAIVFASAGSGGVWLWKGGRRLALVSGLAAGMEALPGPGSLGWSCGRPRRW